MLSLTPTASAKTAVSLRGAAASGAVDTAAELLCWGAPHALQNFALAAKVFPQL